MTAGTGDAAAAVEAKPKGHAETVHMDEPSDKIDTANGDLGAPPPLTEHTPAAVNGTTHVENGVSQPVVESTVAASATTPVSEAAPAASPSGRTPSEDGGPTPPPPPTAPDPAAAAVCSAAASQPSPAACPVTMTASQPAPPTPVPAAPPALVSSPPALVSRPPASPASSAASAGSPAGRKRSAEAAANSAEPAPRQPRRSSSEQPADAPVPQRTVEMIESSLRKLRREVKAIDLLARQKEREWDNLLRLRRAKEETFQRLRRKREVLLQQPAAETSITASVIQSPTTPLTPTAPAPLIPSSTIGIATPTYSVSSSIWALKQQQDQQRQQQERLQQQQRMAHHQAAAAAAHYAPRVSVGLPRPLRPVPVPPPFVSASVSSTARLSQPPRPSVVSEANEPQYREILAQVARLNQRLAGPVEPAVSDAAHASNLAKLLMEKKKIEPALLEMLKQPHIAVRPPANGPLQMRSVAPVVQRPPPPPPPPAATEVPLCQGCGRRQAQFVCAGCGHQWYCSRDCQVEAWDSHADNCSG
ncbi:calphotin-like isoform X1 [Amphibalanus amphitrite]|uniref:calphotin-like isoform X1 n=1 Tax=Amphibalanus amphitrite TaxID=1232801 RepID=UPI001C9086CD|nr:calphotin-like isoform X1 [Amphibalanus amphitrite]